MRLYGLIKHNILDLAFCAAYHVFGVADVHQEKLVPQVAITWLVETYMRNSR